jgi:hypothetical protein
VQLADSGPAAEMEVRERILVEVMTNGATEQAEIERRLGSCDIREHIQWLVDAGLLERSGPSDNPLLTRGKRLAAAR